MTGKLYNDDQMSQVWSWIHDERRCVTVRSISLNLGIDRKAARALLEDLPEYGKTIGVDGKEYEVTRCVLETEGNKTVVRLAKDILNTSSESKPLPPSSSSIYSLALILPSGAPSPQSAHEFDMAQLQTTIQQHPFDSDLCTSSIQPSAKVDVAQIDADERRKKRMEAIDDTRKEANHNVVSSIRTSHREKRPKTTTTTSKKVTTAASFFGTASKPKSDSGKKPTPKSRDEPPTTKASTQPPKKHPSQPTNYNDDDNETNESPSKTTKQTSDDTDEKSSSTPSPSSKTDSSSPPATSKSKTLKPSKPRPKPIDPTLRRGTADDFVGDVDEDDDDAKSDLERKKRIAKEERKQIRQNATAAPKKSSKLSLTKKRLADTAAEKENERRNRMREEEEEDNDDDEDKEFGAMDSFIDHSKKKKVDVVDGKRRRKRLVEKTSVDDKGYLHTETVSVWEDIPEDEEKEQNGRDAKKQKISSFPGGTKVKNTKNMKQVGLMGFFSKK